MGVVLARLAHGAGMPAVMLGRDPQRSAEIAASRVSPHLPGCRIPDSVRITARPEVAFAGAAFAVSAVPTQSTRAAWAALASAVPAGLAVASGAKGLELVTQKRPTEVLAEVLGPGRAYGVLSGPAIAEEIARDLPGALIAASADKAFAQQLQRAFSTSWFRLYTHDDVLGVELAGAAKNVVAIAAGILDGLKGGCNAKSALLARGAAEIARLGTAMGARQDTFFGLAGVGDLATTCFSPQGRNRTFGELLGQGLTPAQALARIPSVVEGVPTAEALMGMAKAHGVDMPICQQVHAVLFHGLPPAQAIHHLIARPHKPERIHA